ncbi:MAG: hypothetical protein R3174_12385 [Gammaproteobacteria bacterium]|nr:hypothetical protein [Gammaproteobacteria bacterium]
MRNLLYGTILVILGIFLAMGFEWAKENFVPSPTAPAPPSDGDVRYPDFDYLRTNALRELADIPAFERQQVRGNISAAVTPLDAWLGKLRRAQPELICVGESHDDVTRAFLARRFFPRYPVDTLMLESTHDELAILLKLIDSGSSRLSLLKADVAEVIRAARLANPRVAVRGIEESRAQFIARFENRSGSREHSIVENFRTHFRRGKRHAVLYGALHCIDEPSWFYGKVRALDAGGPELTTLSVNVVNAHESGETEAFVNFLEALELPPPPFVVPHTSLLHVEVYAWFPQLSRTFLQYDAVIVF